MEFHGGARAAQTALSGPATDKNTAAFNRCTFKYSGAGRNGFSSDGEMTTLMFDCVASQNEADGFNYHSSGASAPPKALEVRCVGRRNGRNSNGNNNGSTMHDGGSAIRVDCHYHGNQDYDVHDVGGSHNWMLGCLVGGAPVALSAGASGDASPTRTWLDECTLGSSASLTSLASSVIYTNGCTISGTTSGATVASYTP